MFPTEQNLIIPLDTSIENLKAARKAQIPLMLPDSGNLLLQIYKRLQQRHATYATDDLIADEVLHLLDEEIHHEKENGMIIVDLNHNETAHFAPLQNMASAIAAILRTKGECFPNDLKAKGFTPEEIKRQWSAAYGLAKIDHHWMDDKQPAQLDDAA